MKKKIIRKYQLLERLKLFPKIKTSLLKKFK